MKETLSTSEMAHRLYNDDYANFSYAGAFALIAYLEECEMNMNEGEEMEFDRVAIRCEFSEYETLSEIAKDYNIDEEKIEQYLLDTTTVIEFDGGYIIGQF